MVLSFSAKKDIVYFCVIWGVIILILYSIFADSKSIVDIILRIAIVGYLLWVWFGASYTIEGRDLIIRFGGIKRTIPISDINKIGKTKSLFSAPALAMDRIKIMYGTYGYITISPKDEKKFIEKLLKKNPKIDVEISKDE